MEVCKPRVSLLLSRERKGIMDMIWKTMPGNITIFKSATDNTYCIIKDDYAFKYFI